MHLHGGGIEDSVSGVIPEPVIKINKMAESGNLRFGVNELGILVINFNKSCVRK